MFVFERNSPEVPTIYTKKWYTLLKDGGNFTIPSGHVMVGAKVNGIELDKIEAESINFQHADFCGAVITNSTFLGTNLIYSKLNGLRLIDSSAKLTTIRYCDIDGLMMDNVDLENSEFRESTFNNCYFNKVDFISSTLHRSTFTNCKFIDCQMVSVIFNSSTFKSCDLSGTFIRNMLLSGVKLIDTDPKKTTSYPFAMAQLEACITTE